MTHERKTQLVFLAVEKNLTRHSDFDKFVAEFNTSLVHTYYRTMRREQLTAHCSILFYILKSQD